MSGSEEVKKSSREEELEKQREASLAYFKKSWANCNVVPGLRLTIGDGKKQSDAFTLVTWCVSPVAAKKMLELKAERPHEDFFMFLLAVPEDRKSIGEVICKLAPFSQMAEFLAFRRPGNYRIFGIVFRDSMGASLKTLKRALIEKDGRPGITIFDDGRAWREEIPLHQCFDPSLLEDKLDCVSLARAAVTVPKEFFAKERPEWLKSYVDGWYDKPSRDDCQFWRRGIFAFTVKPVLIVLFLVFFYLLFYPICTGVKLLYAVAMILCGIRIKAIDWKEVFDPGNWAGGSLHNIFRLDCAGPEDRYHEGKITGVPIVWIGVASAIISASLIVGRILGSLNWLNFFTGLGVVSLSALIIALIVWALIKWLDKAPDPEKVEELKRLRAEHAKALLAADMEKMVCSADKQKTGTLADVPEEMRTFHLLVNAFKRTHCRPFAK